MRLIYFFIFLFFIVSCKSLFHSEGKSGTVSKRYGITDNQNKEHGPDSVVVTGAQYIPMLGKSETGVNPGLEGKWVLESMDGFTIKGDVVKKLDSIAASKIKLQNNKGEEITYNTDTKITPQQGSNYHIPERPSISFFGANETFSGFTGCNKFSGRYEMADSGSLSLSNAAASTRMVCIGDYDEQVFLDNLHKVNKFKDTDNRLELMDGDKVLLTFTRKQ